MSPAASPTAGNPESLLQPRYIAWIAAGEVRRVCAPLSRRPTRVLSPLRNVPVPSLGNPILGHYLTIGARTSRRMMGNLRQGAPHVLTPEALHQLMVKGWLAYPRPQFMRDVLGLVAGYGC
ncbi:hypothetical protein FB451DRAFT_1419254 [Mycena latifolia]|nr:hypothetical protein FB451DRAFT_1419254 [Mycena latifolia]